MSRISRIGRSQVAGAVRDTFERKIAEHGNIPNMYRVFAHRPWFLTTMDAHFAAVMGSGHGPPADEGVARGSDLAGSTRAEHCMRSQTLLAARTGVAKEKIDALPDFENGPFDEKERAALRYGLQVTRDPNSVSDEVFAELARPLHGTGDRGDHVRGRPLRLLQPFQRGAAGGADASAPKGSTADDELGLPTDSVIRLCPFRLETGRPE